MVTRARSASGVRKERRQVPLSEEYSPTVPLKHKAGRKRKQSHDEEQGQEGYIDSKSSRRILDLGQDLAAEDEAERQSRQPAVKNDAFSFESRFPIGGEDDEEAGAEPGEYDDEEAWGSEEEVEEIEVDPNDLDAFNRFNPSFDPATLLQPKGADSGEAAGGGTNLTDLILAKIAAHEAQQEALGEGFEPLQGPEEPPEDAVELPEKVVEAYGHVGKLLSRYKSGKMPKPFKVLPTLPQCDTLLAITRPDSWSANAVYEATKIFSSSRPEIAQFFNEEVLLPRVREDIHETKKLNVHLYNALKKTLYKPAAFFKGLVFPLLESGTCTLREATIIASVVARVSIPVLHSAAALYHLCEIASNQMTVDVESAGACNIFIRTLLEKKYALPYRVIDELVFHFLRFRTVKQPDGEDVSMGGAGGYAGKKGASDPKLPVLWHQCLLAFAQRYKNEIEEEQRDALLDLLKGRGHKDIGPEVRRELVEGKPRGTAEQSGGAVGGDDTMVDV
ncbi:snoRNA-binding rRNA-processing protein [Extremus antarcticus]|uniref:SnoRNA-binding rRNA-processing protein n=1 Tax=Extremus antarcticus TaxID=702011 RepID=A0AAJ0LXF3_9PEZI|nr:snoRNA-binding rRNA-processing protein [Extremus antarcticus]